jgi:metallo-beta-lactamase class B
MTMKRPIFIIALLVIFLPGIAQVNYQTIKISDDLELIKLSQNAWVHVSYTVLPQYGRISENGLIFINKSEAFLFDTPWNDSLTKILVSYLKDNMGLRIAGFIPNHWHEDCMGGLGYLQTMGIESYANQKTIDIARERNLPLPSRAFQDSLQLHLGDKIIDCYFLGAAHSLDNIVIWIPSEKILFAGCMVKSLNSPDLGNIADGDIKAYPGTIDRVIAKFKNAKVVIPGHGPVGGFELIQHTRKLLSQ